MNISSLFYEFQEVLLLKLPLVFQNFSLIATHQVVSNFGKKQNQKIHLHSNFPLVLHCDKAMNVIVLEKLKNI